MNTICPKCGKDDTIPFSDSVYKTHGFECHNCKSDFGVDDGVKIKNYEEKLQRFYLKYTKSDNSGYQVIIDRGEKITLTLATISQEKILQPYEPIDFSSLFADFDKLIFEKLFILDWTTQQGQSGEELELKITFADSSADFDLNCKGKTPVYFQILDYMFTSLIEEQGK